MTSFYFILLPIGGLLNSLKSMKPYTHAVLFSGGLDSTSLFFYLLNKEKVPKKNILLAYMKCGSRQDRAQLEAIGNLSSHYDLKVRKIICPMNFGKSNMSLLNQGSVMKYENVLVPARNLIFFSYFLNFLMSGAVLLPEKKESEYRRDLVDLGDKFLVYFGSWCVQSGVETFCFDDSDEDFIYHLNEVYGSLTDFSIEIKAPFSKMKRKELVKYCPKNAIKMTYSCYSGNRNHCGKCNACILRKKVLSEI